MVTNDQTPPLLALPVELVGRIADSLTPESLLMLRLTCKVLEHSTYDLFSKTFIERRYCCIIYEPRWLLLDNIVTSRLGSRVREVTFTPEPLESKQSKDLQLAPNESQKGVKKAQADAQSWLLHSVGPQTQAPAWPSSAVFHRVFRDLKRLAPKTCIKIEFLDKQPSYKKDVISALEVDVLVAAVATGVALESLKLDLRKTRVLESGLVHLGPELRASTRSLRYFELVRSTTHDDDGHQRFFKTILESANDLREFVASMLLYHPITTSVLRANGFSQLTTLSVQGVVFRTDELITGLSTCRSILHIHLASVGLSGGEAFWPFVFRALASLSQLHQLSLIVLRGQPFNYRCLIFGGLIHGRITCEGKVIEYEGRRQTMAGLDELRRAPLSVEDGPVWGEDGWAVPFELANREVGCHVCGHGA